VILGWIALVAIATVVGGRVGQKTLADEDTANDEFARAEQAYARATSPRRPRSRSSCRPRRA